MVLLIQVPPAPSIDRSWCTGSTSLQFTVANLSARKRARLRVLVERTGCELLYSLPYLPNFSPIKETLEKVKGLLRKAEARSREALVEAMGKALDTVTTARDEDVSSSTPVIIGPTILIVAVETGWADRAYRGEDFTRGSLQYLVLSPYRRMQVYMRYCQTLWVGPDHAPPFRSSLH